MFENIQEIINELHRMKKEYNAPQGCCVRTQDRNGYRSKCLSMAIKALSEVQILAQAKAEGRLVVLPCKVGTVVYAPSSVAGYDSIISGIVQYFVVHEQFIDLFVLFKPNPNEDKYDFAEYIRADKIGKTVFLSREAAEKAIGGTKG